jgi:hypothetical protein
MHVCPLLPHLFTDFIEIRHNRSAHNTVEHLCSFVANRHREKAVLLLWAKMKLRSHVNRETV